MEHYCDSSDFNKAFYYCDGYDIEEPLKSILADTARLMEVCGGDFHDVTEYPLLVRCLSE